MVADAPVPDTGSAAEDFRLTLRGMMGFYTSMHWRPRSPHAEDSVGKTGLVAATSLLP